MGFNWKRLRKSNRRRSPWPRDAYSLGGLIPGAVHIGKGVIERDIENKIPDKSTTLVLYCGGGFRSALTCDVAQKLGYRNVSSLIGGYKFLVAADWPMAKT